MQAFNQYLKILKKNLGGVIIYLMIFMAITSLFSSFGSDTAKDSFSMKKLNIAVLDRDNSQLSIGFKEYMGSIHHIVDMEDNVESLQDNLYYRNVSYILIIPKGYGEKLSQGNLNQLVENIKVPNSFEGIFADQQIDQYLKTISSYLKVGYEPAKALTLTKGSLAKSTEVTMIDEGATTTESQTDKMFFFFQYLAYVLVCVTIVGLGPILLTFSKPDLKKRIDVSALSLPAKNRQLIFFSFFFTVAIWLIFMILAYILCGTKIFSTAGLLCMLNSFIFALISLSITYLVSLILKTSGSLSIISNVLGLGMSFICGVFVPQSYMSEKVLSVSRILPGYWYMDAHNKLVDYNGSSSQVKTIFADFGILLGFAVVILAVSLVVSKVKRDNA